MVSIIDLWLPILLSATFVFILSSIIHMVLPYHRSDFGKVPKEDEMMDALRPLNIPPGDYVVPRAFNSAEMKSEEFKAKVEKGPVIFMTVRPNGMQGMASNLIQWFLYSVIVGIFAAYVAGRALEPGNDYLSVFRFAGTTAFAGYSLGLLQTSIWYGRSWSSTLKSVFDGLLYALVTAGTFGWLWP
jgi:hypothetical protein